MCAEGVQTVKSEQWSLADLLIALVLALIVVGEFRLAVTIWQVDAETARVEEIIEEVQEQIDAYYAARPARKRPVVVSVPPTEAQAEPAAPVVTVIAPEEPGPPEWYIADLPLDRELQKALWDACQEFSIDYALALAIIEQETNYSNILGDGGASVGFFQVQSRWWGELMERIGADDLTDPVDNFRTGCAVLQELLLRYNGSVTDALTAYNSGHPGQSAYASAVMERAEVWR